MVSERQKKMQQMPYNSKSLLFVFEQEGDTKTCLIILSYIK